MVNQPDSILYLRSEWSYAPEPRQAAVLCRCLRDQAHVEGALEEIDTIGGSNTSGPDGLPVALHFLHVFAKENEHCTCTREARMDGQENLKASTIV
jgi:hypothetical protein